MKGSDIDMLLGGIKAYGGVLAIDQLRHLKRGKMYVVNTKPADHPGEHWIVVDWTNKRPYFFDSFGNPPKFYGLPKIAFWKRHLQHPDSDTCGVYSVYYVIHRSRRYSALHMFEHYGRNRKANDEKIVQWLKKHIAHVKNI